MSGSLADALQSENPSVRAAACRKAGEVRDQAVVPLLVDRLDDYAADVRMFAILALEKTTSQTLGYRFYDDANARDQAILRWREWLKQNRAPVAGERVDGL